MGKLTGPQHALLKDISYRGRPVYERYPPAMKLVELGLAEWKVGTYGDTLRITPAGRQALTGEPG